MSKNIVICSDGTGNSGGKTRDTNVWRVFNGVDLHCLEPRQISYYDDGVGTDDNKYLKLIGGALGLGFTRNVKEAYHFLTRNYRTGDKIFMFGFSRGAYTVRALAAFVTACGVIEDAMELNESDLDRQIDMLVKDYHRWRLACRKKSSGTADFNAWRVEHDGAALTFSVSGPIDIQFLGVWDTVSALGLPFDIGLKRLILNRFKFQFQDAKLNARVRTGRHALAIDEQRASFQPVLWEPRRGIEQVWFAGVHSDVGGGYPQKGLAYVTLQWMVREAQSNGLVFAQTFLDKIKANADVHQKLYDSRSGVGAYYRYGPRELAIGDREVKIHHSVFERMHRRTVNYNPGNIPTNNIQIVDAPGTAADIHSLQARIEDKDSERKRIHDQAYSWIARRKSLHLAFVLFTILITTAFGHYLIARGKPPMADGKSGWPLITCYTWHYFFPILAAILILIIIGNMRTLRNAILGFLALAIAATALFGHVEPVLGPFSVPWVFKAFNLILPGVIAEAAEYFTSNFLASMIVSTLVFLGLLAFRRHFRRESTALFEQSCNLIRP